MVDFISMVCPPGVSCPLTSGFGLPEILLWVLTFALTFTVLTKLGVFGKKPAALIALVLGFFVLMAAPAALITAIAGMSTGMIALLIGAIIILGLIGLFQPETAVYSPDGKSVSYVPWMKAHGTAIAALLILLAAVVFFGYGGADLIGLPELASIIPSIGAIPWILIIVALAVLWMLF
jgi:hypothetical protein